MTWEEVERLGGMWTNLEGAREERPFEISRGLTKFLSSFAWSYWPSPWPSPEAL